MADITIRESGNLPAEVPGSNSSETFRMNLAEHGTDEVIWYKLIAEMAEEVKLLVLAGEVAPEGSYVLELPAGVLGGIGSGMLDFLKSGSPGSPAGSLFQNIGGEKVFKGSLPLQNPQDLDAKTLNGVADSLHNVAVQQQMAAIAMELEDIRESTRKIEAGMRDDRMGEILAAKDQLWLASKAADKENRRVLTRSAIGQLSTGLGKISQTLKTQVQTFQPIPENRLAIYWKMATSPENYAEKKDREYNEIKDYADVYREANNLLAAAYMMIDEPAAAEEVFRMQGEFWDSLDLKRIGSIGNMYPELDMSGEWFRNPAAHVEQSRARLLESSNKYGTIAIELTGKQLLEAIDHDQT